MRIGKHNISKFDTNDDVIKTGLSKSELSTGNLVYLGNDKSDSNFGIVILYKDIIKYKDLLKDLLKSIGFINEEGPGIVLFMYRNNFSFAYLDLDTYTDKLIYTSSRKYNITHVVISIADDKVFANKSSLSEYMLNKWNKLNGKFE